MKHTALFLALTLLCTAAPAFAQKSSEAEEGIISSFQELAKFIQNDGVPHKVRLEAAMIEIPTKLTEQAGPMAVRWDGESGVIHFIQALPVKVEKDRLADVEEAVLRINHGMPLPGFGVNHDASVVYYRLTVPLQPRGGLLDREVRAYFSYTFKQANEFTSTFEAVAKGDIAPDKAIAFYRNSRQAEQPSLAGTYQAEAMGVVWTIVLKPDFTGVVKRGDVVGAETKYEIKDGQITFRDTGGPMSCKGTDGTADPGVFKFELKDGKLQFEKVSDDCGGRAAVLVSGPWTKVEEKSDAK